MPLSSEEAEPHKPGRMSYGEVEEQVNYYVATLLLSVYSLPTIAPAAVATHCCT